MPESELPYMFFADLGQLVGDNLPDSILSRTLWKTGHVKSVLFNFDAGQSLSEHAVNQPAIIHIVRGQATLTLGSDEKEAADGTLVYLPPGLKHSVLAKTRVIMLLLLFSAPAPSD